MICVNCSKLHVLDAVKQCKKCKAEISINLQIICNICSDKDKKCSFCLKNLISPANAPQNSRGCARCGHKK
jgi:hypothetical protein